MFGLSALVHMLLPTAPPWLAAKVGTMGPMARVLEDQSGNIAPGAYAAGTAVAGNPVAAMPSVHVAWTTLACLVFPGRRKWRWLYPMGMTLALMYLGEHFLVDGLAGAAIGLLAWRVTAPDAPSDESLQPSDVETAAPI